MDDQSIFGTIGFVIGAILGIVLGWFIGDITTSDKAFALGYGQALIDAREGNQPRYKMFYRGDGTMTWIKNEVCDRSSK